MSPILIKTIFVYQPPVFPERPIVRPTLEWLNLNKINESKAVQETLKMEDTRREVAFKISQGEVIKPIDQLPEYKQPQLPETTLSGTGSVLLSNPHLFILSVAVAYMAVIA
jgi:hypothetical protein